MPLSQVLTLLSGLFLATRSLAATLIVTENTDHPTAPLPGSLRHTIAVATPGDTIEFAPSVTVVKLAGSELLIDKNLSIAGFGKTRIDADRKSRAFRIAPGVNALLTDLTILNGLCGQGEADVIGKSGGAILNEGHLAVTACVFSGNAAGAGRGGGGDIFGTPPTRGQDGGAGGAIFNAGTLDVQDTVFTANRAGNGGPGGTRFVGAGEGAGTGGAGGAIANQSPAANVVSIQRCTFEGNMAGAGGTDGGGGEKSATGGMGGAFHSNAGTCAIRDTTFALNAAGTGGDATGRNYPAVPIARRGDGGAGGGLALTGGALTLTNCTLSGNQAGDGWSNQSTRYFGNGGDGGGIYSTAALDLVSCSLFFNQAGQVGGSDWAVPVRNGNGGALCVGEGFTSLRNTLIGSNYFANAGECIFGPVSSHGHNLVQILNDSTGITSGANGDLGGTKAAPLNVPVAPLGDHGGPTPIHLLLSGNPAIDAGDDTLTGTDQRGEPRLASTGVDIGAVEVSAQSMFIFDSASDLEIEEYSHTYVRVLRAGPGLAAETVQYATVAGTATADQDYLSQNGVLTFVPGEGEKTVGVPLRQENEIERDETFTIELSSPSPGTSLGAPSVHTVTLRGHGLGFAQPSISVAEDAGSVELKIVRGNASAKSEVFYHIEFVTASREDIVPAGKAGEGFIKFAAGQFEASLSIPIVNDAFPEPNETFKVRLGSAVATVTILSDDPGGVIQFGQEARTVSETDGLIDVTVVRTINTAAIETVYYEIDGSAQTGTDYSTSNSNSLTFLPGETEKTIRLTLLNDAFAEPTETISIRLFDATQSGSLGDAVVHTMTVLDDDAPGPGSGVFGFAVPTSRVFESAPAAVVRVVRTGDLSGSDSVQYRVVKSGAADTTDVKFLETTGTLIFTAGESERLISLPLIHDAQPEPDEEFQIVLSAPGGGAALSPEITHTVAIVDSLSAIAFATEAVRVSERARNVAIVIRRSGHAAGSASAFLTVTGGDATPSIDFMTPQTSVFFLPGQTEVRLQIPILSDQSVEGDESFVLTLSGIGGDAVPGDIVETTITIADFARAGIYHGLATSRAESKLAEVTVATTGLDRFTGAVRFSNQIQRFAGQFGSGGSALVRRQVFTARGSVPISFTLTPEGDGIDMHGTVNDPATGALYEFRVERATEAISGQSLPGTGYYTALLSAGAPASANGFLTANVRPNGVVVSIGALPDGSTLTHATRLTGPAGSGRLALYFPCHGSAPGYLGGYASLLGADTLPLNGVLLWEKPKSTRGFTGEEFSALAVELRGARYLRRPGRILDDFEASGGAGFLRFSGSGIAVPLSSAVTMGPANRALFAARDPQRPVLQFQPATGLFTGFFLHPDGKRRTFRGSCVQQEDAAPDIARGFFIAPTGGGVVELEAAP